MQLTEVSLLYLRHRLPDLTEVDVRGISAAYSPWETSETVRVNGCPLLDTLDKGTWGGGGDMGVCV